MVKRIGKDKYQRKLTELTENKKLDVIIRKAEKKLKAVERRKNAKISEDVNRVIVER